MKRAVITILGTIQPPREEQERAKYYFSDELKEKFDLKKERYTNMLPLLFDNFQDYGDIKSIFTQLSKKKQMQVLEYENLEYNIEKNGLFISENSADDEAKYSYFLDKYNELIEKYEKVIIDVSHGFRHFPILSIVNLIIQNIKNPEKIEYIFFAKEITQHKEYEIIDLREYLELSKLSFVLSSFNDNYTVGNKMNFANSNYQKLVDSLKIISTHILGNSLKKLIGKKSLTDDTIQSIEALVEKDTKLETFKIYTDKIINHLERIRDLDNEDEHVQLYRLSKMMKERGYFLNSITLLNEAIGFYCVEELKKIDNSIKEHILVYNSKISSAITNEEKKKFNLYQLSNDSKIIIKKVEEYKKEKKEKPDKKIKDYYKGMYLFNENENEKSDVKAKILKVLQTKDYKQLSELIEKIKDLRNNLAHGNSSDEIDSVEKDINALLAEYPGITQIPNKIDVKEKLNQIQKEIIMPKKKKVKIIPKGIDAPKEKIDELTNLFGNR